VIFTIRVPYTRESGAQITIQIRDTEGNVLHEGPALIATGSASCLMEGNVAVENGLKFGEPYIVVLTSDDKKTAKYGIVFELKPPESYPNRVVLGMAFLSNFSLHFDGPYGVATLMGEIPN
jgi:hypothetical protein